MSLDEIIEGISRFFSIGFWLEVFSSSFNFVFDFFSDFIIEYISNSFSNISIVGDTVLSSFYKVFASFNISDFLLIFVGFVFIFFITKLVIRFIRG